MDLFLTPPSSSGLHICKAPYYELSCRNHLNRAQERGAAPLPQLSPAEDQNRRNPHQKYCGSGNGGVHLSGGFLAEGSRADRISQQIFGCGMRNCALFLPVLSNSNRKSGKDGKGIQLQKTTTRSILLSLYHLCRFGLVRERVVNEDSGIGDFPRFNEINATRRQGHQQVRCMLLSETPHDGEVRRGRGFLEPHKS